MATRAELTAELVELNEELVLARATYRKLIQKVNKSYGFESAADGEQSATKQSMKAMREEIQWLQGEIIRVNAALNGGGVARMHSTRWQ